MRPAGLSARMGRSLWAGLAALGLCAVAAGQNISTVAGTAWLVADGGQATSAQVSGPRAVAFDLGGNLYIADTWHHRVRKVSTVGAITTVAGNGNPGYSGDGGVATAAQLYAPSGVAVDSSGNLYIADLNNHRIRKVDAAGIISTIAGTGIARYDGEGTATSQSLYFPSGLALDTSGDLYIADQGNNRVRKLAVRTGLISTLAGDGFYGYYGEDGQPATRASLAAPTAVALDANGNLFIADTDNNRIRKVLKDTGIISTVAGTGDSGFAGDNGPGASAQISSPQGLVFDSTANLYISDTFNDRVRRLDPSGTITTVAGNGNFGSAGDGGLATAASLASPGGLAVDAAGNLYIAVQDANRIRKITKFTGIITTFAGSGTLNSFSGDTGPATAARLYLPQGVATDASGNVYIADTYNNRIRKVDTAGIITTVAGNGLLAFLGDGGAATAASLALPFAVAVDSAGNVYIADTLNNRIRRVAKDTGIITTVAGTGTAGFNEDNIVATGAQLSLPIGIAMDSSGNFYIADMGNHRIRKVAKDTGIISTVAGTGTAGFGGDGGSANRAYLHSPQAVAVDASNNLYIADTGNERVRKVTAAGIMSTLAGSGVRGFAGDGGIPTSAALATPSGVAADPDGNVYIADTDNQRVRKVSGSVITTVAGGGLGSSGDGGLATLARLYFPAAVAVNAAFDVHIADQDNNRVRVVTAPPRFSYGYQKGSVPPTVAVERGGTIQLGETRMGSSVTAKIIVTNISGVIQTARSISVSGAGFSTARFPALPRSVANAAQFDFDVVFTPTSFGLYAGVLMIDGAAIQLVGSGLGDPLSFQYLPPVTTVSAGQTIRIPDATTGSSTKVQFWVTNGSGQAQTVSSISVSGSGFSMARPPALPRSLPASGAGVQFDFDIVFNPTAATAYTGVLMIDGRQFPLASNGGEIYLYDYLRTGAPSTVNVKNKGTVQFSDVALGSSTKNQFWVTNNTVRAQMVYDVSISGAGFSLARVPALPVNLNPAPPGVQFDFDVVYTPTAVGSGTGTLTINGDSFQLSAKAILGTVALGGLSNQEQPAAQRTITVTLNRAPGVSVTGTAALSFSSTAVNSRDDPNIKISGASGTGRSLDFTICATCTTYQFTLASTGTVAGSITLSATFKTGATDVSPASAPTLASTVQRQAPVLTNVRLLNRSTSGFDIEVTGYSTTRDLTQASFSFTGTNLQTTSFPVTLTGDSTTWFGGTGSTASGGSFKYTQTVTATQGDANNVNSVSVTLTNTTGTSASRSGS